MAAYIHTAAGTKFSLSAALPATLDAAGYAALTYTEIGEVVTIPDFGGTTNVVNHSPLSNRYIQKFKGSINAGSGAVECASLSTDAGQVLLRAAAAPTAGNYSVKIEEADGAVSYFRAIFTSFSKKVGTIDNVVMISSNMEITTPIVDVAAP